MKITARRGVLPSGRVAVLAAVVLVLFATVLLVGGAVAQERTGDPAKWRIYWTQLMPVFTHPRCINCHGVTDPGGGDNHGGGPLDEEFFDCYECHTANTVLMPGRCERDEIGQSYIIRPDGTIQRGAHCVPGDDQGEIRIPTGDVWDRLGPDFRGKDMRALCDEVKQAMGPAKLLEHVRGDALIGFAFEGKKAIYGGALEPPAEPEPPPMSREEFTGIVLRWITEAAMACSTDGTLVFADNVMIDSPPSPFGKTKVRNKIDASVLIKSEIATSDLRYDETSTYAARWPTPGCTATSSGEVHFMAEGKPATKYEINIGPGGRYRMRFFLDAIEGETLFGSREDLCRPTQRRREELPAEPSTELRFGAEGQALPPPASDPHLLILRGSMTVPNDFSPAGVISGGERKVTWDIVIK